jgi:hypothetical protein
VRSLIAIGSTKPKRPKLSWSRVGTSLTAHSVAEAAEYSLDWGPIEWISSLVNLLFEGPQGGYCGAVRAPPKTELLPN